ncbi:glycerate kinase [Burkholderia cepacia]|uniref:glycerate kinase n=1 Tax=Burkholderia cepacia TaxID=292 RepID=UPI0022AB0EB5|nr:glycerate kinase [Burkholderia cepacia]
MTETVGLHEAIRDAHLVVTGEGCLDGQPVRGKAPIGIARIAGTRGVPVIAISGAMTAVAIYRHGVDAMFASARRACSLGEAF